MKDKIKELLTVLNMPEEEQIQFLVDYLESSADQSYLPDQLADLAFWLRDEVKGLFVGRRLWWVGLQEVYVYVTKKQYDGMELRNWFYEEAQPIHWIISSLIAKELSNENKS